MGSCLSKKDPSSSSPPSSKVAVSATKPAPEPVKPISNPNPQEKQVIEEQGSKARKEIFVIKHRRSHERSNGVASDSTATSTESESGGPEMGQNLIASNVNLILNGSAPPRTSSCTKEEVDAILIQCGRLSRSSSGARKYSGSKRSYDFDNEGVAGDGVYGGDEDDDSSEKRLHRQSRASPQGRRRRTPSREREQSGLRSNSRERNGNGGSRRVSRSPGRRSENNSSTTNNGNGNNSNSNRPGKMISVPATVTSLVMDKSNNGTAAGEPTIKRVTVKRNVSPARANPNGSTENPRAPSPARANPNGCAENPRARSPARNNPNGSAENPRARSPARANPNGSAENLRARSPARANPNGSNCENARARSPARCNENQQQLLSRSSSRKGEQSPYRRNPLSEIDPNSLAYPQPCKNNNNNSRNQIRSREFEADGQKPNVQSKAMNVTLTRSRSSRRSQDLDFNNSEALQNPNPNPSYTSLLLEDIQNFHQKSTTSIVTPSSFQLPACVTKANSIVEAVADLNSSTSSNLTDQISGNRRQKQNQQQQRKDPFMESEVVACDDLMEPSFHKYVTVTRGGGGEVLEEEESSGSNSFVGQRGISISSSFEPNSADSTDRWASRSDDHLSQEMEEARRGFSGKRRDFQQQSSTGIGRGRAGGNRGSQSLTIAAST